MTKESNGQRMVGISRGLFRSVHTETGKPTKITFKLVDVNLSEYKTGILTFRQITARSVARSRSQQILIWSKIFS